MRVIVIGAGIGGLALAQALRRTGIDVVVYERDARAEDTGGYRLQLDDRACDVLRRRLSPAHYQALMASSAPRGSVRQLTRADHRLRTMSVEPSDPSTDTLFIGRVPLRVLLAHGLDEHLSYSTTYEHHEVLADGRVLVSLADGRTDVGDVLVGADGARSRVAAALAGRPTSAPIGFGGIAARTPLTAELRERLPAVLDGGPALAIGPDGAAVFLTAHDPSTGPAVDPAACTEIPAVGEDPAVIWGLNVAESVISPDLAGSVDGPGLVDLARRTLASWPASLRHIVAGTDPDTAAWFRYHAADPDADLTPWSAGPVTALGDAVHAMPPTGGRAAATAIRDADHLADALIAARDGTTTIPLATHRFHRAMAGYAPDAVRESLRPLRWVRRLDRPGMRTLAGAGLTAVSRAAQIRRAVSGRAA